jgi:hypothetical protein
MLQTDFYNVCVAAFEIQKRHGHLNVSTNNTYSIKQGIIDSIHKFSINSRVFNGIKWSSGIFLQI